MTDAGVRESKESGSRQTIPVGGPGLLVAAASVGYCEGFASNTYNFAPAAMSSWGGNHRCVSC
jgi:hypothetical protein